MIGSRHCTSPRHLTHTQRSSQVLERVARLDRVLSRPGGAALLCGKSGIGRRSVLRLLAYMHHMEVGLAQQPRLHFLAHKLTNLHGASCRCSRQPCPRTTTWWPSGLT